VGSTPTAGIWQSSQNLGGEWMLLKFLMAVAMWSSSYNTEEGRCHVARRNAHNVNVVCLSNDAIAEVPATLYNGTYQSRLVTIYYTNGEIAYSTDPDMIDSLAEL
jgi:hypothetical protein